MTTTTLRDDDALDRASAAIAAVDEVMAGLVDRHGPVRLRGRRPSHFEALARSIVFQQLSGKAAATIWGRLAERAGGRVTAETLLPLADEELRAAGLSRAKTAALRDLATRVESGELRLAAVARRGDDAVVEALTTVRGIGPWTAQMFLMFQLRRADVWPTGDLGVRNGYARAYRLRQPPTPEELATHGERFRPYRSVAAWYCWRVLDTETP